MHRRCDIPVRIETVLAELDGVEVNPGGRIATAQEPLVSVVVPTLNAASHLPATLDSMTGQTWPAVEVIVVDGGSTDGTVALLAERSAELSFWISAADRGIADGFNRGIALCRGGIVQITNAGDRLQPDHLARVVQTFAAHPGAGFVYGDVRMIDRHGRETRRVRGCANIPIRPFDSMAVAPHPSLAVRRTVYETIGLYDPSWPLTMDFDWLARAISAGVCGIYDPTLVAEMAEGGASNARALRRDLDNFRLALRHRTMSPHQAALRLCLKGLMDLARSALERTGRDDLSQALRRGIDRVLGRS